MYSQKEENEKKREVRAGEGIHERERQRERR